MFWICTCGVGSLMLILTLWYKFQNWYFLVNSATKLSPFIGGCLYRESVSTRRLLVMSWNMRSHQRKILISCLYGRELVVRSMFTDELKKFYFSVFYWERPTYLISSSVVIQKCFLHACFYECSSFDVVVVQKGGVSFYSFAFIKMMLLAWWRYLLSVLEKSLTNEPPLWPIDGGDFYHDEKYSQE